MAVTAIPYGQFLTDLASGRVDLSVATFHAALLTAAYTVDQAAHKTFADVQAWELANDSDSDGYQTGGRELLDNGTPAFDAATSSLTYNVGSVSWAKLTGTVRYVVIYDFDTNQLRGLYDLGETTTYAAQPLQLTFTDGLIRFAAAGS